MSVVTRFAPSPTGKLHIGSVRTALFSWLYARRHQGEFLLRIEDTDRQRSTEEATQLIFESMSWLGLDYDREPVFQSQRLESYGAKASELVEAGKAYYCTCTKERLDALRADAITKNLKPRYDNKCRDLGLKPTASTPCTIRFRNPMDGTVVVDDMVQGRVEYQNAELDDLIIIRTDGTPTYNFAVVVDEIDMGCTHVIRGDDHLNNTPRQINLFHAFGKSVPVFGHVPMILSPEGRKLSKRENEASVLEWHSEGYLPEAVLNYLVRLGWSHGDQELFSVGEMVENFDVKKIHRSPASLDHKKFQWINHQHMMKLSPAKAIKMAEPFFEERGIEVDDSQRSQQIFEAQQSRSHTLLEFVEKSAYFFSEVKEYDEKAAAKHLTLKSRPLLAELRQSLAILPDWKSSAIHAKIAEIVQKRAIGFSAIAQPARVALTGSTVSPGIDVTIELVGRDKVLQRLDSAMDWIDNQSG
ncbi:MAG: glutamate--tRNA ligase [Gammaproteobacteria bacterium]|nr:glutamate--tRNA ligase [Gammaproteobacteria bacterium]